MDRWHGWLIAAVIGLVAPPAAGQQPPGTYRLAYHRGPGAAGCPDEQELRDAIRAEVGRDPFAPSAPTAIEVAISRKGSAFRWDLRQRDAGGQVLWAHSPLDGPRCALPLDPTVFAIVSHFFPTPTQGPAHGAQPTPPPPPTPAPTPPPRARDTAVTRPPSPARLPTRSRPLVQIGNGAWALFGATPSTATPGISIDVGLRWSLASIAIEGRSSAPGRMDLGSAAATIPGGSDHFTVSLRTATLVPCLHYRIAAGCALLQIGELTSAGTATAHGLQGAAGARLGLEIPFVAGLRGRIAVDLLGTMRPITICRPVDSPPGCPHDNPVAGSWVQPRALGGFGAGIAGFF